MGAPGNSRRARFAAVIVMLAVLAIWLAWPTSVESGAKPNEGASGYVPRLPHRVPRRDRNPGAIDPVGGQGVTARRVSDAEFEAVRFLDLSDGSPVPNLTVAWSVPGESGDVEGATTNEHGLVDIPKARQGTVRSGSAAWTVLNFVDSESHEGEVLRWCYRTVRVIGSVINRSATAGTLETMTVTAICAASPEMPAFERLGVEPPKAPWTSQWFRRLGVPSRTTCPSVTSDGRFDFEAPRIRGLRVSATTEGGQWSVHEVNVGAGVELVRVVIELEQGHRIRGRLLDENGLPMRGVSIRAMCQWRIATRDLDVSAVRALGHPVATRTKGDVTWIWVADEDTAGPTGEFDITIRASGDVAIYAWPEGRRPVRLVVGSGVGEHDVGSIVASFSDAPPVQVAREGTTLGPGQSIMIVDVSASVGQPSPPEIKLSDVGTMPGTWLEVGRRYHFHAFGPELGPDGVRGFLTWEGGSLLDLGELEVDK
jgi:hypothetical protein